MLRTSRLLLREFVAADLPPLRAIESSPDVLRHMTYARSSEADYDAFLRDCAGYAAADPRESWELAVVADDVTIGRCGLKLEDRRRQAMVWYLLDPACWGRGYATEAVGALLAFAFEELGLHRVYADVDPSNAASARVCERVGMRREAWFVENVEIRGAWCDTWIYGLLHREWVGAKDALQSTLRR
jgi:ribosomal-protein-alanine N-acetyltransferase